MLVRLYRSLCWFSLFLLFIQYIRRTRNYYFWNDTLWKLSGQTRSWRIYSVINTSWVIAFILIGLLNYVSWDEISLVLHFYNILLMASFIKCIEIQQRKKNCPSYVTRKTLFIFILPCCSSLVTDVFEKVKKLSETMSNE